MHVYTQHNHNQM